MGFLDNLENTLNAAERGNEREDERAAGKTREAELAALRAAAPNADVLKKGQWTQDLLTQCVTIGHGLRMRVGMAWIGTTLRLEAKEKRLELQPGAAGIDAVFFVDGVETGREAADLAADPGALARRWLGA